MINLAVFFGGESCEHDISIITGVQLINNCNEYLYNIIPIYIDKNGNWLTGKGLTDLDNFNGNLGKTFNCAILPNDNRLYIKKFGKYKSSVNIDVAIICMHGLRGEDGSVASILNFSKIPYSSSSICASSICLDKAIFKNFCKGIKLNIVEGFELNKSEYFLHKEKINNKIKEFGLPIIIKPSRQGSSIGIELCESVDDIEEKLSNSFIYDEKILIEKFLNVKKEVNIALFKNKGNIIFSNTEEPISNDKILSFDDKYKNNAGAFETIKRIMPAEIEECVLTEIKSMAKAIYNDLDMFGVVRFDFIIDDKDNLYLNEVNTIPGSMANYLFDKKEYSYSNLIDIWVSNAIYRSEEEKETKKVYDSKVLKSGINCLKK